MKFEENTQLALILAILPWAIAYILYKYSLITAEITVIMLFLVLSFLCFSFKKFAVGLKYILDRIGAFLGKYIAVIVLTVIYILAVLPTGILMKTVKRDRLRLKKRNIDTYWTDCGEQQKNYEYQF